MQYFENACISLIKTSIMLNKIKTIFDVSFYLTHINIYSYSSPQSFVFLIFTFVRVCQNLLLKSLLSKRAAPTQEPSAE